MNAAENTGSARQRPSGRLARFEDGDVDTEAASSTPMALPPRRRRKPVEVPAPSTVDQRPRPVVAEPAAGAVDGAIPPAPGAKGIEDKVKPSNVHIPVRLLEPLTEKCRREGLSHGEVIIIALEGAYPRLGELIHSPTTAGGSLFASRRSRTSRNTDGPLTPLNYRLRAADFDVIDGLVEEFHASSRGQLVTAALNDLFGQT